MKTNQTLNSYIEQRTLESKAFENVVRTMNPYNAVNDFTEKDEARMNMYRLRSQSAQIRLERQRKAALKSDIDEVRDIVLCYVVPIALLVVGVVWLYIKFR